MKFWSFCISLCFVAVSSIGADAGKVARVAAGELDEAYASWWGYDGVDDTEALQAALNSRASRIVIDRQAGSWVARPLEVPSNKEIVFQEGVELLAKRGEFKGITDTLMRIRSAENVTLRGEGKGAMLRMHKADYHTDEYQKAEWRHGISILSSKNIRIENLTIKETGGDGIYLGIAKRGVPPTDIVIKKVICDGNNRQGISVISAVNMLIEDTHMINTEGTAPQAGIDFEPNRDDEPLRDIVMRNCLTANNKGGGYMFYLPNMRPSGGKLGITLEKCVARDEVRAGFNFTTRNEDGTSLEGYLRVVDCLFERCEGGLWVASNSPKGVDVSFENVVVRDCDGRNAGQSPFVANPGRFSEAPMGGIRFRNVVVEQASLLSASEFVPIRYECGFDDYGVRNVTGDITFSAGGERRRFDLAQDWAAKTYPGAIASNIKVWSPAGKSFKLVAGGSTGEDVSNLPDMRTRGTGVYWVLANSGETVKARLFFGQLGRYEANQAAVNVLKPSGKTEALEPLPFKSSKTYSFVADEPGVYQLRVEAGANWSRIESCNRPVWLSTWPGKLSMVSGGGKAYVYVPRGSGEFAFRISGDPGEALAAKVYDPDGNVAWSKDVIVNGVEFVGTAEQGKAGGLWSIELFRAKDRIMEDHHLRIYGVPPFLVLAPQFAVEPQ